MKTNSLIKLATVLALVSIAGCDEATKLSEDVCGPCGEVASGDVNVSGVAELDGFFSAVASLGEANASIRAQFDADILAIADAFGVEVDGEVDADLVDDIIAEVRAEVTANVEGDIQVAYTPPKCEAQVSVALEAQAKCEVQAGCEVDVDPGKAEFECSGKCEGTCEGQCGAMADLSCKVKAPGISCSGECTGSCELETKAACSGTCRGECDGTCEVVDGSGNCAGACDGECTGTCEISGSAECSGTCHGSCTATPGSAECMGAAEVECSGSCMGMCSGKCEGEFEPPSASASCEASADCKAQAKAQAEAKLECTPPALDLQFTLKADLDASVEAEFLAKLNVLKVRGRAILQGGARLEALIDGTVDGEVVFENPPLANVKAEVDALVSAGISGDINVPSGRIACVIPAFEAAAATLVTVGTEAGATVQAQAKFASALTGGFSS